jgi:predicted phosphodiesterase
LRYAILSDIHANLHALEAVLEDLHGQEIHRYCCLGDVVGYGAFPNECVKVVRDLGAVTVAGNHDFAVLGKISIEHFNAYARAATLWTRETLAAGSLEYLHAIPLVQELDGITLVHGSLYSPELFDYVQTSYEAYLSLSKVKGKVCFIGHSHIPIAFTQNPYITYSVGKELPIPTGGKILVNVGSVGQPRDQNPRASYAIYDEGFAKVWIRRIPYDVEGAIEAIRHKGLPIALGERLRMGV